jgi:hypothetical protein
MSIVSKPELIDQILKYLRKQLEAELPEENDFEYAMYERAVQIINSKLGHIKVKGD